VSGEQLFILPIFLIVDSVFSSNIFLLSFLLSILSLNSFFSDLYFDSTVASPFNPSKALRATPHAPPSPKALRNQATVILCTIATLSELSSVVSAAHTQRSHQASVPLPPTSADPSGLDCACSNQHASPRPSSSSTENRLYLPQRQVSSSSSQRMMGAGRR